VIGGSGSRTSAIGGSRASPIGDWLAGAAPKAGAAGRAARAARASKAHTLFEATHKTPTGMKAVLKQACCSQRRSLSSSREIRDKIRKHALKEATPVSLKQLYAFGSIDRTKDAELMAAKYLAYELPIRFAQRAEELSALPLGLSDHEQIVAVREMYMKCCKRLFDFGALSTASDIPKFETLLREMMEEKNQMAVVQTMAMGVMALRRKLDREGVSLQEHAENVQIIDPILDRFYMSRIGLRFIVDQYIESKYSRPGFSGIIESECSPKEVARQAAEDASMICRSHFGVAPAFEIVQHHFESDFNQQHFTYVPMHMHYIILELMKNALRATVQRHMRDEATGKVKTFAQIVGDEDEIEETLPPVKIVISVGDEDVTFKISDEGGGIPRSELAWVWTYMHSTAARPNSIAIGSMLMPGNTTIHEEDNDTSTPLAGYGVGLPMSRLYARYFGGDLDIKSMEGFGTDCYLHLNRCELLCVVWPLL
jgi:pyruvate dehydrogenase kinase 2/3/4